MVRGKASAAAVKSFLGNCSGDDSVEVLTCTVTDTLRQLLDAGVSLDRLRVRSRTLDDLFLELTGKEIRP